nr:hypothetical protein JVH1_2868 [Rhodococcus sp. JVH1]
MVIPSGAWWRGSQCHGSFNVPGCPRSIRTRRRHRLRLPMGRQIRGASVHWTALSDR